MNTTKNYKVVSVGAKRIFAFVIVIAILVSLGIGLFTYLDKKEFKVCIDAGHGGSESTGAVNGDTGRLESEDNLKLAFLVKTELEKRGAKVIMTRTEDEEISLGKRCSIANRRNADYFLCLHRNSSDDMTAHGTEMWISSEPTDEEKLFAENLLSELEKIGISDNRGIKKGFRDESGNDYYINSHTNMASCLVELGFISNSEDNNEYDEKINEYAAAIAKATLKTYEVTNGK